MEEYQILRSADIDIQKWMNQWKHQYHLEIMHVQPLRDNQTYMVLKRTPKKGQ